MSTTKQDPIRRTELRAFVNGIYELQHERISAGNRIVATVKSRLGIKPSQKEEEAEAETTKYLEQIRDCYSRIADGVTRVKPKQFVAEGLIGTYAEYVMTSTYLTLIKEEEYMIAQLKHFLADFPIYTEFLVDVKGCGDLMSTIIITELDIYVARYPSSFWKYAGLDVVVNAETGAGEGRSRKAHHLVDMEYKDREGKEATRKSITYNPWLKTKLIGVLGGGMLKAGIRNAKEIAVDDKGNVIIDSKTKKPKKVVTLDASGDKIQTVTSKYARVYLDYKNRLINHPRHMEKTDAHRHNMAVRYMVKIFLADLYVAWKGLEGLEIKPPYAEAKLGIVHRKEVA